MKPSSRIILAASALALIAGFVLPLWRIDLKAPQYPEGIGMLIRVNTITGVKTHDLDNINKLNHYIGMKAIEPDSIPELEIMPWILGFLVLSGLAAAAFGKKWMLFAWLGLLAVVGVAGMADFFLWGHDYGHNLDPTAAIKVPGMTYQPPLVGSKALLNFIATSWPAAGGLIILGAGLATAIVGFFEVRKKGPATPSVAPAPGRRPGPSAAQKLGAGGGATPRTASSVPILLVAAIGMAGCQPEGPVPVAIGEATCSHCLMTVADERYATELITTKGKVHFFDSVECLAHFYLQQDRAEVASMWVTDFHTPSRLIPVGEAFFLRSKDLRSPMGMDLTAFGGGIDPETVLNSFMGEILDWDAVLSLVEAEGPPGAGMGAMPGGHGMEIREGSGGER
ncbi:MAG: nitrous oxide reductase accessory protein NosL [Gemmatimonadota bacterium]